MNNQISRLNRGTLIHDLEALARSPKVDSEMLMEYKRPAGNEVFFGCFVIILRKELES